MTYVISQPCVDLKDRACVDECPVDCIYEGKRMLYIHPDECVDCGACEPVCPVEAIFYEDDVPEECEGLLRRQRRTSSTTSARPAVPPRWARSTTTTRWSPRCPRRSTTSDPLASPGDFLTSPGTGSPTTPSAPVRTRTGSSTCRSARLSTRRPRSSSRRWPTAADSPGYPLTVGRVDTRQACIDWLARRHGVTGLGLGGVLPVIGSKELIASMPGHLGLGAGDLIVYPELAYPTYEVGAVLAGARGVATDSLTSLGPETPALLWLNSPSNPTGRVLPPEHLKKVVDWCRERGDHPGLRRVLPRVRLGGHAGLGAAPVGERRLPRGHPRRPLALEALQPGRLPLRLRRRRPGPGRRAARRPQEPRACRCPARSRPR